MSNGQGLDGEREPLAALERLAARNACTRAGDDAGRKRFKLARDLRAVEKGISRKLFNGELMRVFDEWHRLSQSFLDPAKTRDDYLAAFLAELRKVRVPTGEGDILNKALEHVSKLSAPELPLIPDYPNAPESWRRIAALHRELSCLSTKKDKTYFLSYRDAAKAFTSLSHQTAYNITLALERLGAIKILHTGEQRPGGKASAFRYLLPTAINPF